MYIEIGLLCKTEFDSTVHFPLVLLPFRYSNSHDG